VPSYAPGPKYIIKGSLGKQALSMSKSAPQVKIGKERRDGPKSGNAWTPGPGSYNSASMVGHQASSTKPTTPMSSISGRSRRTDTGFTNNCTFRTDTSFTRKRMQTVKQTPAISFATSSRFNYKKTKTPGPGAYASNYSSFGNVALKRSAASFSMGLKIRPSSTSSADVTGPGRCRNDTSFKQRHEDPSLNRGFSFNGRPREIPLSSFYVPGPGTENFPDDL
jgi:hypothetical protein